MKYKLAYPLCPLPHTHTQVHVFFFFLDDSLSPVSAAHLCLGVTVNSLQQQALVQNYGKDSL